ncbi:MAG: OmpA family protein [Gammaproteobacteria bacterium]|nr:OmpA family protein [Gammaproteobacteria bacterium]
MNRRIETMALAGFITALAVMPAWAADPAPPPPILSTKDLWGDLPPPPPETIIVPEAGATPASKLEYVALSPIYFESGKATLTHEGQQALDAAVTYIRKHKTIKRLLIEGNADSRGSVRYNDRLSDRRAEIVRSYLTVNGIDPNIMAPIGKGEHVPADQNWSRDGQRRNRQVAIIAVQRNESVTAQQD